VLERGFLTIARFGGAPIRLHWSVPIAALVFTRFEFAPGAWLGILLLILFHEMGHAVLVKARGARPTSIDLTGFGGLCRFIGSPTPLSVAIIAWGGVLAQALVGITTFAVVTLIGMPHNEYAYQLVASFLWPNVLMMAFNLIPIRPLDGAEAWKLPGMLWRSRKKKKPKHKPVSRPGVIDEDEVRETVREALERAARESREGRNTKPSRDADPL
jgi:stage IV sporulation protein FB